MDEVWDCNVIWWLLCVNALQEPVNAQNNIYSFNGEKVKENNECGFLERYVH